MSKEKWFLGLVSVALALNVTAAEINYSELMTKNLDEMQEIVSKQIRKADGFLQDDDEDGAAAALRSAVEFILSRPNSDNMVSQLMPSLRTKLRELGILESTLEKVVDNAIIKLSDSKSRPAQRATYYFVLENFLSEFKPDMSVNEKVKKIFIKIRDAKIKLDSGVINDLKLRAMMKKPESPSVLAARVLGSGK